MKASKLKFSYQDKVSIELAPKVSSSKDAYQVFLSVFPMEEIERREFCFALYLNRANKVKGSSLISIGGQAGTVVDPKILFQEALVVNAASIILAHNHPSGALKASEADERITAQLVNAGNFLSLPLVDHLIITKASFISMADEGIM